jgi:hypothetical protein
LVGKNGALYLIDFGSATVVTYDTDKVSCPFVAVRRPCT